MNIDFSRFSPDLLHAIETAARIASNFGSGYIMPCHLVVGLASVNGEQVCSLLQQNGYDPDASLQAIAQGVSESVCGSAADGVSFHSSVEDVFSRSLIQQSPVTILAILKEMVESDRGLLSRYLIKAERRRDDSNANRDNNPPTEVSPYSGIARDYRKDDASTGETIKRFCINMLEQAAKGKYHRAIGRGEEVKRVLLILARSSKNNPVLVGEPGTGKTAIAEELAIRLLKGEVPLDLADLKLYNLDFSTIKASPDSVGVMKSIVEEASGDPLLVLFIDEIHMLISANSGADNDIANLMKPAMARGDVKIFGATTLDEYKRIEKDPAFERRFQKVTVDEPDDESAIKIIIGSKKRIEDYHHILIPDEVCRAAVSLSSRYITNRKLPDKAIDLIDEAAANLRIQGGQRHELTVNDVMKVVTDWTGIPVDALSSDEKRRLQNIEQELKSSVVGQDKAVKAVSEAIIQSRAGFGDPNKPIGSFLFLGTTGTGKTELCKAVAKFLFKDSDNMVRIDMSEYQQEHSSQRLFGAPPGYAGFEQGGQLTEAVYRKPFSVILFDEIEKAHPKIFETLLQILDDGRMTDGKGKVVNFKNTLIVMTSNIGQQLILNTLCGREVSDADVENCTGAVMEQLRLRVAPEFLNRIDQVVMFNPLKKDDVAKIADINLKKELKKLKAKGFDVAVDHTVLEFLVEKGYKPEYGGRPIKRAINDYVIKPLSGKIIREEVKQSSPVYVTVENNEIVFKNVTTGRLGS